VEETEENTQEAGNELQRRTEQTGEEIKEGAQDAGNEIQQGAEETGDKIQQGVDETGNKIQQGTERTEEHMEQGAERANDKLDQAPSSQDDSEQNSNTTNSMGSTAAPQQEIEVLEEKEGPNNQVVYKYQGELYYVDREQKQLVKIEESQLKDAAHKAIVSDNQDN
jgi:gas vesicle protein